MHNPRRSMPACADSYVFTSVQTWCLERRAVGSTAANAPTAKLSESIQKLLDELSEGPKYDTSRQMNLLL